jgi:hypothetical protein
VESQEKRLDRLIRQGMMPARQLPILHRALASIKMGKVLTPYERAALSRLIDSMMGFTFGDDIAFNRARLHTQKTKYQTEEQDVVSEADVVIYDGTKDEQEAMRDKKSKKKGKLGRKNSSTDTNGPGQSNAEEENMKEEHARGANRPADKHEGDTESPKQGGSVVPEITDGPKQTTKQDAEEPSSHSNVAKVSEGRPSIKEGMPEWKLTGKTTVRTQKESTITKDIEAFNAAYKEHLTKSLEDHGVDNIRDIPQAEKKDFFEDLDETITKKHLKQAKGIAFDKRYKGGNYSGAAKAMEKLKPGLSDHPEALKHLKHANEQVETPLDEGSLKDYALGHGYFDNSGEGKRKRADNDWLSKQSAHGKKTLAYPKKKVLKSDKKVQEDNISEGGIGGAVKLKDASKVAKSMRKNMGLKVKSRERFTSKNKDGKITGYGGKTTYTREEADTEETVNELPRTEGSKVRAVHQTVADVLAGKEFETLVVDPNVELQKETDRVFNNVQEGAREDAMRDIKNDSKGLAPLKTDRPDPKKSKHDGSANKGPEHIVAQMRKAVSLGDKHDGVKFKDGKTHKVSSAHAHKFLNKYMDHKPADKVKMQDHAHASHENFKTHIDK